MKNIRIKNKVIETFYPKRGYKVKLMEGKKAISDFKKLKPSPQYLADLMLIYVETGVQHIVDFGGYSDSYYNSLLFNYKSSLELMCSENLLPIFSSRIENVLKTAYKYCYFKFSDQVRSLYDSYTA